MSQLKLMAIDVEDLKVLSAHVQDAVFKIEDFDWHPKKQQLTLVINRFVWEDAKGKWFKRSFERRRAALTFARVKSLRTKDIDRAKTETVYAMLALDFTAGEVPAGSIDILCAKGATLRLDVECIEAQLTDLGAAWSTESRPDHERDADF